jgi:nucleoside-diphosphate-sugar epimerase
VARVLIVGGGCRGRRLAAELTGGQRGHAVRATTRTEAGRAAIEQAGAECWIGTPDRLATLRGALENVTLVCWLLATARGSREQLDALHGSRLEFFLGQAIDTTVRGFVYESATVADVADGRPTDASVERSAPTEAIAAGASIVRSMGERNAIPVAFLTADPTSAEAWLAQARATVAGLLEDPSL